MSGEQAKPDLAVLYRDTRERLTALVAQLIWTLPSRAARPGRYAMSWRTWQLSRKT